METNIRKLSSLALKTVVIMGLPLVFGLAQNAWAGEGSHGGSQKGNQHSYQEGRDMKNNQKCQQKGKHHGKKGHQKSGRHHGGSWKDKNDHK